MESTPSRPDFFATAAQVLLILSLLIAFELRAFDLRKRPWWERMMVGFLAAFMAVGLFAALSALWSGDPGGWKGELVWGALAFQIGLLGWAAFWAPGTRGRDGDVPTDAPAEPGSGSEA